MTLGMLRCRANFGDVGSASVMDIVQLVTLAVGILGLVWYQQRSIASLRAELKRDFAELRVELKQDIAELRVELKRDFAELRVETGQELTSLQARQEQDTLSLRAEIAALREAVVDNSQRLSRIEGFLGIGMPPEAAAIAPGARWAAASAGAVSSPPTATSSS